MVGRPLRHRMVQQPGLVRGLPLARCHQPSWSDLTGFGFSPASTKDQPLAETFFALRAEPNERLPSAGSEALGPYVADKGFEGEENHRRWLNLYGARIICPPKRNGRSRSWPKRLRRWAASIRQIVETVYEKLHNTFGLRRERPHDISGLRARLAARVALHNCENVDGDDLQPV
jgi:DDE family transposase